MNVLLLHGFTGSLETVEPLNTLLTENGYRVATPILRGHGSEPDHLFKVTWRDWAADARTALLKMESPDPVAVIGLSMGSLLACHLAAELPSKVSRIALLAPAFSFRSPLIPFAALLRTFTDTWPAQPEFVDPKLYATNSNYPEFPIESLESLLSYIPVVETLLPHLRCPVGVFTSTRDKIIARSVPKKLSKKLKHVEQKSYTYHKGGHEMLQDLDRDQVCADVLEFLGGSQV